MLASTALEEVLLGLKLAFLVLLYLFIWRIVRTVGRDMRLPQESFILKPQQAAALGVGSGIGMTVQTGKLVVEKSPYFDTGDEFDLDSTSLTIGRSGQNDVSLEGDEFASARHVRIDPRRDGVWVQDLGSTNGTYVNGIRIDGPRRLTPGDLVRVGETELRYER